MATKNINIRIEEDLEKRLQSRISKNKQSARGGMEINLSTVVRYALEKYLEEEEKQDNEVLTVDFDLRNLDIDSLKKLSNITKELHKQFSSGYKDTIEFVKTCALIDSSVEWELHKRQKEECPTQLSDLEKEEQKIIKKYSKK